MSTNYYQIITFKEASLKVKKIQIEKYEIYTYSKSFIRNYIMNSILENFNVYYSRLQVRCLVIFTYVFSRNENKEKKSKSNTIKQISFFSIW